MKKIMIILMAMITVTAVLFMISCSKKSKNNPPVTTGAITTTGSAVTTEPPVTQTDEDVAPVFQSVSIPTSEMYTGDLILVDKNRPYTYKLSSILSPAELDMLSGPALREKGFSSLYAEKNGDFFLRSRLLFMRSEAYTALEEMISAFAVESGRKDIQICYAYTVGEGADKESGLYDEAVTGLSVDINVYTAEGTFDIGHGSKKSVYYDWFAKNAAKYGFIMNGTSGHFRYVGVPHAVYMAEKGLLLSEYIETVREYGYMFPLSINANGAEYDVYYVKAADGAITSLTVKNGAEYEISGDNISGFIVTVKK